MEKQEYTHNCLLCQDKKKRKKIYYKFGLGWRYLNPKNFLLCESIIRVFKEIYEENKNKWFTNSLLKKKVLEKANSLKDEYIKIDKRCQTHFTTHNKIVNITQSTYKSFIDRLLPTGCLRVRERKVLDVKTGQPRKYILYKFTNKWQFWESDFKQRISKNKTKDMLLSELNKLEVKNG